MKKEFLLLIVIILAIFLIKDTDAININLNLDSTYYNNDEELEGSVLLEFDELDYVPEATSVRLLLNGTYNDYDDVNIRNFLIDSEHEGVCINHTYDNFYVENGLFQPEGKDFAYSRCGDHPGNCPDGWACWDGWYFDPEGDYRAYQSFTCEKIGPEEYCEYGCENGECNPQPPPSPDSCEDSDGRDYYTKGNVTGYSNGEPYTYFDTCVPGNIKVVEYYCEDTSWMVEYQYCENGCLDGKCKTEEIPTGFVIFDITGFTVIDPNDPHYEYSLSNFDLETPHYSGIYEVQVQLIYDDEILFATPPQIINVSGYERCDENWSCTSWSACTTEETQTRSCVDLNNCGTTYFKPAEQQPCNETGCIENWQCGEWSDCVDGKQTRTCVDLNNCKPEYTEHRDCSIPSCFDGIKNQGEEGIDCGGPCEKKCEKRLNLNWFLYWIIVPLIIIFMIIGAVLLFLKHKKTAKPIKKLSTLKKEYPNLHSYINTALKKGLAKQQISNELRKTGWPQHIIDKELSKYK